MIGAVSSTTDFEETLQKTRTILVFNIENQSYALSIEHVAQIIPMLRLTPVPQMDRMIEGVANIHGAVVPVISTRRYLGLPHQEPGLYTPIVLTRVGERLIGLIVDEVRDVITVPGQNVVSPKDILPEGIGNTPVMSGVVYLHDQSILLLEPRHLLRPTQARTLNQAIAELRDSVLQESEDGKPAAQLDIESVRAALAEKRIPPIPTNGKHHAQPEEQPGVIAPAPVDCEAAVIVADNPTPVASEPAANLPAADSAVEPVSTVVEVETQPANGKANGSGRKKKRKPSQPAPDQSEGDVTA